MTALGQGSAGLALVMCFALLRTGRTGAALILLAVQSGAVAVAAAVLRQPLMAIPPVVLGGGLLLIRHRTPMPDANPVPVGGTKLGIGVGAVLAVLCQSQGALALPLAIVLLSVLLAATRPHPVMQVIALIAAQNGLALAGGVVVPPVSFPDSLLLPAACLALPLPLAAGLLLPLPGSATDGPMARDRWVARLAWPWRASLTDAVPWLDLGLAAAILGGTLLVPLVVPLDPLALVFAPLFGLDGVVRAWTRRKRRALTLVRRGSALAQSAFIALAACLPNPMLAWLAVLAAMAMAVPALSRRRQGAALGFLAAGLALFGLLVLAAAPSVLGYFSLFAGFATIAAMVPDLAAVLVIVILRLANQAPWPFAVQALGCGMAVIALLACALLLTSRVRLHRTTLLLLSHASIAALAICIGQAEGRFAALVLLILLVLSRSAVRVTGGPAGAVALAGLGGIPPLGVFPGLVLVVLTMSAFDPWLLIPLGVALVPIVLASVPGHLPGFSWRPAVPSAAWLPLLLAVMAGSFAPDGLVHWWRMMTGGAP
jgi:hypothetical protein